MESFRLEYWNGLPVPSPGDLPSAGIEPRSPAWQAYSLPLSHLGSPMIIRNDSKYKKLVGKTNTNSFDMRQQLISNRYTQGTIFLPTRAVSQHQTVSLGPPEL